ncbi:MAG: MMPL family transporter, partial [Candidatus Thermoplasmatota archaeon]
LLTGMAAAVGAGLAAILAVWSTFSGVVAGRIVRQTDKNLIVRVSLFGMKYAKSTVAVILLVTLVAGYYATSLNTNVDVADVLPRGDPNTDAAHNLTQKFKSSFTQQVTFQFHVLDMKNASQKKIYDDENAERLKDRRTDPKPDNITDELYVRAMEEVIRFTLSQPPFTGSVDAAGFYNLINWTIAGGQTDQNTAGNASFSLPDTSPSGELQYRTVDEGVNRVAAVYLAVDALTSPNWTQTAVLILVDPKATVSGKEIGEAALHARDAWVKHAHDDPNAYRVFGPENPPQFTVDLPLANAHASALTKHDFSILLPVIGVFIAVTLYIAFRNLLSVFITFSMLIIAVLWTFGVMGAMRIPLNTLNLAVVPLIMGVGIDYGIHMMNEYDELRHAGKTQKEAWTYAGGGSALALAVGTLTTLTGLLIMVVSPSLLVAQLGLLSAIAISSCFLLAIIFIPAVTTLVSTIKDPAKTASKKYVPSRIMPAFASGVSRVRWLVLVVLVLVSVAAVSSAVNIRREAFGDPPRNWLPSDPLRQEHEKALAGFYETGTDDVKANVIIFEGEVTDPAAHEYINAITRTLRSNAENGTWTDASGQAHSSRIIADTLKDLPFFVNTYITVKDGLPGAGRLMGADALDQALAPIGQKEPTKTPRYPQTQAEIKQTLDNAHDSPLFQLENLFVDYPTYDTTVTIFSVKAATYEDAKDVWAEIQDAITRNEALRPAAIHTSFFGNTAINYLFVVKQVPWLGYMSIGTNIAVFLIVFAFTRNIRATLVVGACNFLSSALWIGALTLPFIDIGLSISLTLPLIFIFCMGSDYGLHLALRCRKVGDTYLTFESVGKGVLYSFVTTVGAFIVFTQVSDLSGRQAMVATSIAITVVFFMTLAVVPIFFPVKKHQRRKNRGMVEARLDTRTLTPEGGSSGTRAP